MNTSASIRNTAPPTASTNSSQNPFRRPGQTSGPPFFCNAPLQNHRYHFQIRKQISARATESTPSEAEILHRSAPGERESVTTLSHPITQGDVGEQCILRPCRRKQSSQKNLPHRRKPKSPPEQLPGKFERAAPLSPFNQKDFSRGNQILFRGSSSGGGAPRHILTASSPSSHFWLLLL